MLGPAPAGCAVPDQLRGVPARPRILCLPTGPDEYAAAVARALSSVADVTLAAPQAFAERYRHDLAGVELRASHWPRHRDPRSLGLVRDVLRLIDERQPDIVHFLGDSVTWLGLALPFIRRPIVVTVHDVSVHPGDHESNVVPMTTVRLLRRAADAIIVHGPSLRDALRSSGIDPPLGVHVIEHPILDRHRRLATAAGLERHEDSGVRRVLFFGRVLAYKGLHLLIEASDRVATACPEARFVVAGRGPELDRLRPLMAQRPWFEVHDHYVPDAELARYFLDADLVALPYVEASQSGVAALATAFGVPIVASDVGELGRFVEAHRLGLVIRPDAGDLARAIIRLLCDRCLHAACAASARSAAVGELSPQAIGMQTRDLYQQILSNP